MRTLLLAAAICAPLLAEEPSPSRDRTIYSPSRKAALWISPQADGSCQARMLLLADDGTPKEAWKETVADPAWVLVPDNAAGVALLYPCDASTPATTVVLSIRDASGKAVREVAAKDLLTEAEMQEVVLSGKPSAPWFSQVALLPAGEERTVVVRTASGREVSLSIADGSRIELADWVKRLGSDDWSEREEASARVRAAGEAALPLLAAAVGAKDPEVRVRALALIDDCRWRGLRVPKEVLAELIGSSTLVFRGKVVGVGKSPGFWSGTIAATQDVKYQVVETFKGQAPSERATVAFLLVHGARLSDAEPRLLPSFFAEGAEHVVFAREAGGKLAAWSESWGALPPVPGVLDAVRGK